MSAPAVGPLTQLERQRLLDERDHLLTSLDDLDAELAAGDIDPDDFAALHDDYTARAAQLTRALEAGTVSRRRSPAGSPWSRLGWIALVVIIAGAGAFAMMRFSGARGTDETASGQIRQSTVSLLSEAAAAFGAGDPERSIELYGEVLELQPTNVEALTYRGWIRYQQGDTENAQADFDEAVAFDPDYADVRVFRAVAALDRGDFEAASTELEAFDRSDPTAVARQLVAQRELRERIATARVLEILDAGDGVPAFSDFGIEPDQAQLAGETLVRLSQPNEALRTFDGILGEHPDSAPAMAWRGWTLALTAESGAPELFDAAELWLDDAVSADPAYPDARVFRAFLHRRLGRPSEAANDLAAFDALDDQPADMVALVEEFGLREVLDQ